MRSCQKCEKPEHGADGPESCHLLGEQKPYEGGQEYVRKREVEETCKTHTVMSPPLFQLERVDSRKWHAVRGKE